ncbi:MAG: quinoprotein dehydrogenase-associated SoxYZ-like carrier [Hyphomicrobium sp.]
MRISSLLSLSIGAAFVLLPSLLPAQAGDDPWPDIHAGVFAGRAISENDGALALYAPAQAEDAALVPLAVHLPPQIANTAKSLTLIIDRNPAPVAATFRFGDSFHATAEVGERRLMTRVRVDSFSKVRAILETADGKLHMATKFVMGAGGCSAPASKDADQALAHLGKIQVKTLADAAHGDGWREGIVMIRHPNFTGMQMDIVSRGYTPARYIDVIEVTRGGSLVWRMEGGISISEDPNIRFNYDAADGDVLEVRATDSNGTKFAGKSVPSGS